MKRLILICSASLVLCALSVGQSAKGEPSSAPQTATQETHPTAASSAGQSEAARREQLRRTAEELAALTRSIPADIDAANKGLLPKDVVEKLNRIEKLSKQLRKNLAAR